MNGSLQREIEVRNEALGLLWAHKYFSRPRPTYPFTWPWVMRNYYEHDLARKRLRARVWLQSRPKPVITPRIHKCHYEGCERTDPNHVHFMGGVLEGNPTEKDSIRRFHLRSVK